MFCLLYSPKQKIVKFHTQQIGKSHVIDIFTNEDMERYYILNILHYLFILCISQNKKDN
jgi:hypothetical protein